MDNILNIVGGAMRADADALRSIGLNLANADSVAYRRQLPVSSAQPFAELLTGNEPVMQHATAVDLRSGALKSTAEPLHIALDGPGFLLLEPAANPQELLLTRRGDLQVSPDGYLTAANGAKVLGASGPIQVGHAVPSIAADGTVSINDQRVDVLRIANVVDGSALQPAGAGMYRAAVGSVTEGERQASIRQGFLEASNVEPVNEMLQLLETVRRFETEQRFARAYDAMLDTAISELGRTT
jgi:flagellar basal-body rod protein FlgF